MNIKTVMTLLCMFCISHVIQANRSKLSRSVIAQKKKEIRRLQKQKTSKRGLSESEEMYLKELRRDIATPVRSKQREYPAESIPEYPHL